MSRLFWLPTVFLVACISAPPSAVDAEHENNEEMDRRDGDGPDGPDATDGDGGYARDANERSDVNPDAADAPNATNATDATDTTDAADVRHRIPITIPAGTVGERVDSFVLLVDFQVPALPTGRPASDQLSFSDTQGVLPFELEFHDPTNGDLRAWVLVPALLPDEDTVIYLDFEGRTNDPAEVWAAYNAVWHFEALDGMGRFGDASGKDNHLERVGTPVVATGTIGNSVEFDGEGGHLVAPGNATLEPQQFTISMWAWVPSSDTIAYTLITKPNDAEGQESYQIGVDTDGLWVELDFGGEFFQRFPFTYPTDTWAHVAYTFDGATMRWWIDGQPYDFTPSTSGDVAYDASDLLIGADADNGVVDDFLSGQLDELRIAPEAFSAERLDAQRRSQANPSEFFDVGPPQTY